MSGTIGTLRALLASSSSRSSSPSPADQDGHTTPPPCSSPSPRHRHRMPSFSPDRTGATLGRRMPGSWDDTLPAMPAALGGRGGRGRGQQQGHRPLGELFDEPVVQELGQDSTERALDDEKDSSSAELEDLAERVLFQAGTEPLSLLPPGATAGPLLVLAPSLLPASTSLPALLPLLLNRLATFASGPQGRYSIVVLTAPLKVGLGTKEVVAAFLRLGRAERKKVGRVWVVHSSWWVRMTLALLSSTFLSTKTTRKRKLLTCPALSSLASDLGRETFLRLAIPGEVLLLNDTLESEVALPPAVEGQEEDKLFGVPLSRSMGREGEKGIPKVLKEALEVVDERMEEGVFRKSPSGAVLRVLLAAVDRGSPVDLRSFSDDPTHLSSGLIKHFLRSLPRPILGSSFLRLVAPCPSSSPSQKEGNAAAEYVKDTLLPAVRPKEAQVLRRLMKTLSKIEKEKDKTKMPKESLVVCLLPCLTRLGPEELVRALKPPKQGEGRTLGEVLAIMIEHYEDIWSPLDEVDQEDGIRRAPLLGVGAGPEGADGLGMVGLSPLGSGTATPMSIGSIVEEPAEVDDIFSPSSSSYAYSPSSYTSNGNGTNGGTSYLSSSPRKSRYYGGGGSIPSSPRSVASGSLWPAPAPASGRRETIDTGMGLGMSYDSAPPSPERSGGGTLRGRAQSTFSTSSVGTSTGTLRAGKSSLKLMASGASLAGAFNAGGVDVVGAGGGKALRAMPSRSEITVVSVLAAPSAREEDGKLLL